MAEVDHIMTNRGFRLRDSLKKMPERRLLLGLSLVVGALAGLAAVLLKCLIQ